MGSHRFPDDDATDGRPDHDLVDVPVGHSDAADDGDGSVDHFGLFDGDPGDAGPGADHGGAHGEPANEVDLTHLREVLAGRRQPDAGTEPGHRARHEVPAERRPGRPRRRHRVRSTILALIVMMLIAGGAVAGVLYWRHSTAAPIDWAGTGPSTVVVRVHPADGLSDVAQTLVGAGVVANAKYFVTVASDDGRLSGLQPGYYRVHQHSAAQVVVGELADKNNRLGQMRVIPGQTLADRTAVSPTGAKSVKQGILSAIAAACVPTDGQGSCFSVDDLWKVEETASPSDLNVVGWAVDDVTKAPDARRRLEGLILPGDYTIPPGSTAQQALTAVVSASAAQWNTTGIVAAANARHLTPYELATVASLVQAEAIGPDMSKVARVIYNRLADGMKLEFDSTVNYGLNRTQISTDKSERLDAANLYSTYAHAGLTPTPIGAPGPQALDAADDPATGTWLYFVAVDLDGNSCFSTTIEQHEACIAEARKNGVFG